MQAHAAEAEHERGTGSRKLAGAHDVGDPKVKKARRSEPQEDTKLISWTTLPVGQDGLGMASLSLDSDRPVTPTPADERQNGAAVAFDDDFFLGAEEQVSEVTFVGFVTPLSTICGLFSTICHIKTDGLSAALMA